MQPLRFSRNDPPLNIGKDPFHRRSRRPEQAPCDKLPVENAAGRTPVLEMAGRTRAIVRLESGERMVTKGYRKGVYERVTMGTKAQVIHKSSRINPAGRAPEAAAL